MKHITLNKIREYLGRAAGAENPAVRSVVIDSRKAAPGSLFVALRGEKFDGHDFIIPDLLPQKGVSFVVSEIWFKKHRPTGTFLVVKDTRRALGDLARGYIRDLPLKRIGITGSNGKTTVKEMTAHILAAGCRVYKSPGNFNNDIGLPLSIFSVPRGTDWGVFELGANHPGEIRGLVGILQPEIAAITCVRATHLEFFRTLGGVARAKWEIVEGLKPGSILVLNSDDPWLQKKAVGYQKTLRWAGLSEESDFHPRSVELDNQGFASFTLNGLPVKMRVPGTHSVVNAVMAAALARSAGAPWADVARQLNSFRPPAPRNNLVVKKKIT
jgi:UDP-N-acetylmuramoyl-tripeptide--D-alanyl-D-alanine ligase